MLGVCVCVCECVRRLWLTNMVRTYKRKTTTKYSEKDLVAAVKAVKEDRVKFLVAVRKFNVP